MSKSKAFGADKPLEAALIKEDRNLFYKKHKYLLIGLAFVTIYAMLFGHINQCGERTLVSLSLGDKSILIGGHDTIVDSRMLALTTALFCK